jgi:hypothetical protein
MVREFRRCDERVHMFRCLVIYISRDTIYYVHARIRYILLSHRPNHVCGVHWSRMWRKRRLLEHPIGRRHAGASGAGAPSLSSFYLTSLHRNGRIIWTEPVKSYHEGIPLSMLRTYRALADYSNVPILHSTVSSCSRTTHDRSTACKAIILADRATEHFLSGRFRHCCLTTSPSASHSLNCNRNCFSLQRNFRTVGAEALLWFSASRRQRLSLIARARPSSTTNVPSLTSCLVNEIPLNDATTTIQR